MRQAAGHVRRAEGPDVEPVVGPGRLGQLLEDDAGVLKWPAGLAGRGVDDDGHVPRPGGVSGQRGLQLKGKVQVARQRLVGHDRLLFKTPAVIGGGRTSGVRIAAASGFGAFRVAAESPQTWEQVAAASNASDGRLPLKPAAGWSWSGLPETTFATEMPCLGAPSRSDS